MVCTNTVFSEKDKKNYKTGIEKLFICWQQVIDSCGEYVVEIKWKYLAHTQQVTWKMTIP